MDRDGVGQTLGLDLLSYSAKAHNGAGLLPLPAILNGLTTGLEKWDGASLDEPATFVLFMFSEFGTFLYRVPAVAIYSALEDPSRTSGHVAPRPASPSNWERSP